MGRRLTSAVAIGAVAALTLAACGSSAESAKSARILHYGKATTLTEAKATGLLVAAYLFDREGKDWPAACSYLSAETKAMLERIGGPGDAGCGKGIEARTAPASMDEGEAQVPEVKELRREGRRAFLIYRAGTGNTNAMLMVMEEGKWMLASLNPTRLSS